MSFIGIKDTRADRRDIVDFINTLGEPQELTTGTALARTFRTMLMELNVTPRVWDRLLADFKDSSNMSQAEVDDFMLAIGGVEMTWETFRKILLMLKPIV